MTIQEFIALIEAVIWPASLLIIILVFRKNIANSFNRLGSITANASGLSLNFEAALEAAKDVFEDGKIEEATAKSGVSINGKSKVLEPYEQLIAIKQSIEKTLLEIAAEQNIPTQGKSFEALNATLAQNNILSPSNSQKIAALLTAVNTAPLSIKRHQVSDLQQMYESI